MKSNSHPLITQTRTVGIVGALRSSYSRSPKPPKLRAFPSVTALIIALAFPVVTCAAARTLSREEAHYRTSGVQLTHKLAQDANEYGELNENAAASGIDFPVLLERALEKDKRAIFLLLWMGGNANLDGAGAEGYWFLMPSIASQIGDDLLAEAAKQLDARSLAHFKLYLPGGTAERMRQDSPKFWNSFNNPAVAEAARGKVAGATEAK